MKSTSSINDWSPLIAASLLLAAANAFAQAPTPQGTAGERNVTVVTLYNETRTAQTALAGADKNKAERQAIQIVDGGVKSAGPSCWALSESGQIVPQAGDCYILRSAAPGEKPPAH